MISNTSLEAITGSGALSPNPVTRESTQSSAGVICSSTVAENECELLIVRHGQTDWNKAGKFQGSTDIPLNETGIEQAIETGKTIRIALAETNGHISAFYSSPLGRALTTGKLILKEIDPSSKLENELKLDRRLRELDGGEGEGKTIAELKDAFPEFWSIYKSTGGQPDARIPGGESFNEKYSRVKEVLSEIVLKHRGHRVLIAGHSGTVQECYRLARGIDASVLAPVPKINAGVHTLCATVQEGCKIDYNIKYWGGYDVHDLQYGPLRKSTDEFDTIDMK